MRSYACGADRRPAGPSPRAARRPGRPVRARVGPDGETSMTRSPGRRAQDDGRHRVIGQASASGEGIASVRDATGTLVIENDPTDDSRRLGEWLTDGGPRADRGAAARRRPAARRPGRVRRAGRARRRAERLRRPGRRARARRGSRRWRRCCARRSGTGCRRWRSAWARSCSPRRTAARSSAAAAGPEIGPRAGGPARRGRQRPALRRRADAARRDAVAPRRDHRAAARRGAAGRLDPLPAPGVPDRRPGVGHAVPHRVRRRDVRRLGGGRRPTAGRAGHRPEALVAATDAVQDDLSEVWQPFAARFAALALRRAADAGRRQPAAGCRCWATERGPHDPSGERAPGRLARYGFTDAARRRGCSARPGGWGCGTRPRSSRSTPAPASSWPRWPRPPTRTWRCASCTAWSRPAGARRRDGGCRVDVDAAPTRPCAAGSPRCSGASSALGDDLVANPRRVAALPRRRPSTGRARSPARRSTRPAALRGGVPARRCCGSPPPT